MAGELLLVGHYEDANQLIPLVVATLGLVTVLWVSLSAHIAALRAFQFVMLVYAGSGIIGVTLHYKANVALQLEADPSLHGAALVRKVGDVHCPSRSGAGTDGAAGPSGVRLHLQASVIERHRCRWITELC